MLTLRPVDATHRFDAKTTRKEKKALEEFQRLVLAATVTYWPLDQAVEALEQWDAKNENTLPAQTLLRVRWEASVLIMLESDCWKPLMQSLMKKLDLKGPRAQARSDEEKKLMEISMDESGDWTPLIVAVVRREVEKIEFLAPLSQIEHQDEQGWDALDFAQSYAAQGDRVQSKGILDFLAPLASTTRANTLFEQVGSSLMPEWGAKLEREALSQALSVDQQSAPSSTATQTSETTVEVKIGSETSPSMGPSRSLRL